MTQNNYVAEQQSNYTALEELPGRLVRLQGVYQQALLAAAHRSHKESLKPFLQQQLPLPSTLDWLEYLNDAGQRSLLFMDTLRQRGDNTLAHQRNAFPLLISFDYEVLVDGKDLPQPVNYSLLRIIPDAKQTIAETKQPIIIIEPRGGYGAGIAGLKPDSEIGESLRAGHPTYLVSFSHSPVSGQTLEHVRLAQARFIEAVSARHPEANQPVVIGNSQAGWALMGLAAARPELPGLVIINGAPLSYWAGGAGRNPMRYAGGMLGGAWLTRLGSDLGSGRFDGAWLVSNFDNLDPANTLWAKYYRLFRNIDTEQSSFLDVERWRGNPSLFNSEEIETTVDELFIGNQLVNGPKNPGSGVDLSQITAPVVMFCSYGDNVTPPQQALNWIAEVYPSDLALRSAERTIVYLKHATVGHLGMFMSGKVVRREHRALLGAIETIQNLPAGLFEMLVDDVPGTQTGSAPEYRVRLEPRSIADIIEENTDTQNDEREFCLIRRVSEANNSVYDCYVRPWMRELVQEPAAEMIRKTHPFHQQQVVWSSLNPLLWWLPGTAEQVRTKRQPARENNPLLAWQDMFSQQVTNLLDTYREVRDATQEYCFRSLYGGLSSFAEPQPSGSGVSTTHPEVQEPAAQIHEAPTPDEKLDATQQQPVAVTEQPVPEASPAPKKTAAKATASTKSGPAKRTATTRASPAKRAAKPAATARKTVKKPRKSAAAATAQQASPTPPMPLKLPKTDPAAAIHTEATVLKQQKPAIRKPKAKQPKPDDRSAD
ncbi:DUF3141 domain-containing protein [Pseudomonas sp. gcc21]|uniref:DUF3141 domain-containing protein n=1 Tax=Pseudomonas sp. gcc21 TaxID=2726989 RepID=UPI001451D28D|nr:DUF3141 domain-containing protein [Pseudomonas sp. gcc21]QJD58223.1 DUF3141 domain-containing protein [Pseudomonas sp. gcc21]